MLLDRRPSSASLTPRSFRDIVRSDTLRRINKIMSENKKKTDDKKSGEKREVKKLYVGERAKNMAQLASEFAFSNMYSGNFTSDEGRWFRDALLGGGTTPQAAIVEVALASLLARLSERPMVDADVVPIDRAFADLAARSASKPSDPTGE